MAEEGRAARWNIELSPEVESWLRGLPVRGRAQAARSIELLAQHGVLLGEPHTRHLQGKLRELRLFVDRRPSRITYFVASGRRIILLTVFFKQQQRQPRDIERALRAMAEYDYPEGS